MHTLWEVWRDIKIILEMSTSCHLRTIYNILYY